MVLFGASQWETELEKNMMDSTKGRVTKPMMQLGKRDTFTNKSLRRRQTRGTTKHWIDALFKWFAQEDNPYCQVLHIKIGMVKVT